MRAYVHTCILRYACTYKSPRICMYIKLPAAAWHLWHLVARLQRLNPKPKPKSEP